MVVTKLYVVRIAVFEPEADPPLVVHGDRILPGAVALQGMESIAGWYAKVREVGGRVDSLQLAKCSASDVPGYPPGTAGPEKLFGCSVGEGLDHRVL